MAPTEQNIDLAFSIRFWPVFAFAAGLGIVASWVALLVSTGASISTTTLVLSAGICVVVLFVLCLVLLPFLRVRVNATHLRGQDFYGKGIAVAFADMTGVRMFRVPGLIFYIVHQAHDDRSLWLPQFLRDERDFIAAVLDRTDAGHPLRHILEERQAFLATT